MSKVYRDFLKREAERSTQDRRELQVSESMLSTSETMALPRPAETANKATGDALKIPTYVMYQGSTWRLKELRLVTHTSGSTSLYGTLERQDEHRLSHIVVIDMTGSLSFVHRTS